MRETISAAATWTTTLDMSLQLGGERERGDVIMQGGPMLCWTRLKEDWKELGVNTVRGWCTKVKDRGWLASKLGGSKKKGKKQKNIDSGAS